MFDVKINYFDFAGIAHRIHVKLSSSHCSVLENFLSELGYLLQQTIYEFPCTSFKMSPRGKPFLLK